MHAGVHGHPHRRRRANGHPATRRTSVGDLALRADLHVHTTASDGLDTPEEVVRRAVAAGLGCVAVTDHDTIVALGAAHEAGVAAGIEVVPAVELSAQHMGHDIHVLGYFLDPADAVLAGYLEELRAMRELRARRIVELVRGEGIDLTVEEVMDHAGMGRVGRAHVARALVSVGAAVSMQEAFDRFLGRSACCYVPKPVPEAGHVVGFLAGLGAAPVLAHPGVGDAQPDLGALKRCGLVGLESEHPEHTRQRRARLRRRARGLGLVATGGSDWHGETDTHPAELGSVTVSGEVVEELRARSGARRPDVEAPPLERNRWSP